jgi:guanylate kinase
MAKRRSGRLVILSGPSCAGKSPLVKALARLHPGLHRALQGIVLHNSRAPRLGERDGVDYHFRPRAAIEALREDLGFVVLDVRGDLQALDLAYLAALLRGTRCSRGTPSSARRSSTNPPWPASRRSRPFSPPSPGRRFSTSAPGPGPTSRGWSPTSCGASSCGGRESRRGSSP